MSEQDPPQIDIAWDFILTAYQRANELPGFLTFQIDTQSLRIGLMKAIHEQPGRPISNIDDILKDLECISNMLSEDSHRTYAVRVVNYIPEFISHRLSDMSREERISFLFYFDKIIFVLSNLSDEFKMFSGSESVRKRLVKERKHFF